jgi:putative membrane protein
MIRLTSNITTALASMALASTAGAVSLSATGPAQPLPDTTAVADLSAPVPAPITDASAEPLAGPLVDLLSAGSAALVPLMAADSATDDAISLEAPLPAGADFRRKSVDDLSFTARAALNARHEMSSARNAIARLRDPHLRRLAETLAADHDDRHARLSRIAAARSWPLPAARPEPMPPAGSANPDFDARWTAGMIASHEQAVALYRAQAQDGEDIELRHFARDTLPALEQNLESLRRLQK